MKEKLGKKENLKKINQNKTWHPKKPKEIWRKKTSVQTKKNQVSLRKIQKHKSKPKKKLIHQEQSTKLREELKQTTTKKHKV